MTSHSMLDIPYIDYDRQKADLSFPELERGAEIYKALPRIMDSDDLPGAADIRDGNALWIYPNDPVEGSCGEQVLSTPMTMW